MRMMTVALMVMFAVSVSLVGITSSASYDPWADLDDDGDIDIFDIVKIAGAYGTTGEPINKTELLLELQARMDVLNASVASLEEQLTQFGTCEVRVGASTGTGGFTVTFLSSFPNGTIPEVFAVAVLTLDDPGPSNLLKGMCPYPQVSNPTNTGFDVLLKDEVDGVNMLTATADVYYIAIGTASSVPRISCLTIASAAFTPDVPRLQAFWKTRYAVGGSGSCFACVQLPDGALITNVTARLEDFYDDAQVSVGLYRVNTTGPSETSDSLASIYSETAAQPGEVILYDDTIDYAQIDNEHFYYVVELYLNYEASDLNLHWVQLTYEY